MPGRLGTGWSLTKQSWHVLKLDKELLLFPLISGFTCILVLASFAVPMWASGFFATLTAEEGATPTERTISYVILFLYYFANYFVIVFFNSALISCAIIRFKGGNPTLGDGFSAAFSRLPQITAWAIVAATVGLIIKAIESRSEKLQAVLAGILGMAWSAATYFVVPVIVVEGTGPIEAAKRSFSILRKTWGESLVANFGVGMIVFLVSLLGMIPLVAGMVLFGMGSAILATIMLVVGVIALTLVCLISSALHSIIIGALYLYAAEGEIPQQFDDELFVRAFAEK